LIYKGRKRLLADIDPAVFAFRILILRKVRLKSFGEGKQLAIGESAKSRVLET
jgi:hypothetical protein